MARKTEVRDTQEHREAIRGLRGLAIEQLKRVIKSPNAAASVAAIKIVLEELRQPEPVAAARRGRRRVVHRRQHALRPPHAEPARVEVGKRLRRRDLVDEVKVDRDDRRGAGVLGDDVLVTCMACGATPMPRGHRAIRSGKPTRTIPRCPTRCGRMARRSARFSAARFVCATASVPTSWRR